METKLPEGQETLTYEQVLEDLKKQQAGTLPSLIKAKIVEINVRTAGEIFGDKLKINEGQDPKEARDAVMIQLVIDTGYEFDVKEQFKPSNHPKSKMFSFIQTYGNVPKIGMEVNLMKKPGKDGRQYYKLVL